MLISSCDLLLGLASMKSMELQNSHSFMFIVLVFLLHFCRSSCSSLTYFVFGDSLVDAGNNDYIFTLSKANSPPYGIDFVPSAGQPTGRFTNGRTITDIIGQALGAKSFAPPFLAPDTRGDAIFRGVNYASGASGILNETGSSFVGRIPLGKQINFFEENRAYMVSVLGENGTMEFLKGAIFSITSGSNDFLNYLQPSIPFVSDNIKVPPTMLQDFMVSNLTLQLKRLHELGARKFIIVDVGPLGCIPFVRAIQLLSIGKRCSFEANTLIQGYNKKLKEKIHYLNQVLGPEAMFVYANSYDIVMGIIRRYQKYGFANAYDPCCGGDFPPFICFKEKDGDSKMSSNLCKDRSKYVFWDAYHPTEAVNMIVAQKLLDGDERFSFPINIRELYHYNTTS